jgi:nicotinamidase-related amidase
MIAGERSYADAGLGGELPRGQQPGVVVVDLILGFTDPAYALGGNLDSEVLATRRLLDRAREGGAPVLFTTIAFDDRLADATLWLRKIPSLAQLRLGAPAVEVDARLGRRPTEPIVVKQGASAAFGTALPTLLRTAGVDTVLLCGATTSGCVRATAVDLLQLGFPTLVPRECVGDRSRAQHDANLIDLQAKYADVIALDEALALLGATAQDR